MAKVQDPLRRAEDWSRDNATTYRRALRDVELEIAEALQALTSDGPASTHQVSQASQRPAALIRDFSNLCRLWLYEIKDRLASGNLEPPSPR